MLAYPVRTLVTLLLALGCAAAYGGTLAVDGNQLTYDTSPIRLRGIALGDIEAFDDYGRSAAGDFSLMADTWHSNVIRLTVHPSEWIHDRDRVLALLQADVATALATGLFPIIDWHTIGFPDGYYEVPSRNSGSPPDYYSSAFAPAEDFWSAMASLFGGDGRIMFELWNEPTLGPDEVPPGPGSSHWTDLKPYWQQLLAVIRTGGAQNVVLATSNHWAHDLTTIASDLLDDPQTAYTWHCYPAHDGNDLAHWTTALGGLDAVKPIVVTEWGWGPHFPGSRRGFGIPLRDDVLEPKGFHFTAWSWLIHNAPELHRQWTSAYTAWGKFLLEYQQSFAPVRP